MFRPASALTALLEKYISFGKTAHKHWKLSLDSTQCTCKLKFTRSVKGKTSSSLPYRVQKLFFIASNRLDNKNIFHEVHF